MKWTDYCATDNSESLPNDFTCRFDKFGALGIDLTLQRSTMEKSFVCHCVQFSFQEGFLVKILDQTSVKKGCCADIIAASSDRFEILYNWNFQAAYWLFISCFCAVECIVIHSKISTEGQSRSYRDIFCPTRDHRLYPYKDRSYVPHGKEEMLWHLLTESSFISSMYKAFVIAMPSLLTSWHAGLDRP